MTVTNEALQAQITSLDAKVDERHEANSKVLDDIGKKMDTLIELNVGQRLQAQLIAQLGETTKKHEAHFEEVFRRVARLESKVSAHGWAWRIVGAVALGSLGATGWMLSQMKEYYQDSQHMDDRIGTLEFLVQGRTTPVLPPAQTTSGAK